MDLTYTDFSQNFWFSDSRSSYKPSK